MVLNIGMEYSSILEGSVPQYLNKVFLNIERKCSSILKESVPQYRKEGVIQY